MEAKENEIYQSDTNTMDDVAEFLDETLSEDPPVDEYEEEVTEEPEKETEEVEVPETAEAEEPVEEEAETDSVEEAQEEEPAELTEAEKLRKQNVQLMEMLNKVAAGQSVVMPKPPSAEGAKPVEGTKPVEDAATKLQPEVPVEQSNEIDWSKAFDGVDFSEVLDNEESFKNFMTGIVRTMYEQQAQQMQYVPQMVQQQAAQREAMQQTHNAFYEAFPELSHVKDYVGQVAHDISVQNPGMEILEVLEQTAQTVRTSLGIDPEKVVAAAPASSGGKKPNLPGSKGTRKPQAKKSAQQAEIDEILDFN